MNSVTGNGASGVVDEGEYQRLSTRLDHGDMVLSYSNVFSECEDERGAILGADGLLRLVRRTDPARPNEILTTLIDSVRSYNRGRLESEDVTLLLGRGTDQRVRWKDNLLAPFRLLRSASDGTQFS